MANSAVPALIDALVTQAKAALTTIVVLDGFEMTNDPGNYLMIGVDDPDRTDAAFSAETQQEWANANGTARDESGEITCVAYAWTGDGSQKVARDAAYAMLAALDNLIVSNPSLGVAQILWCQFGSSTTLMQDQDESGAKALVTFKVYFRARL